MRPDDPMDGRRLPQLGDELPGDADFGALEAELTAAGARARRGSPGAPTPAFAAALRGRLPAALRAARPPPPPAARPAGPAVVDPRRRGSPDRRRRGAQRGHPLHRPAGVTR